MIYPPETLREPPEEVLPEYRDLESVDEPEVVETEGFEFTAEHLEAFSSGAVTDTWIDVFADLHERSKRGDTTLEHFADELVLYALGTTYGMRAIDELDIAGLRQRDKRIILEKTYTAHVSAHSFADSPARLDRIIAGYIPRNARGFGLKADMLEERALLGGERALEDLENASKMNDEFTRNPENEHFQSLIHANFTDLTHQRHKQALTGDVSVASLIDLQIEQHRRSIQVFKDFRKHNYPTSNQLYTAFVGSMSEQSALITVNDELLVGDRAHKVADKHYAYKSVKRQDSTPRVISHNNFSRTPIIPGISFDIVTRPFSGQGLHIPIEVKHKIAQINTARSAVAPDKQLKVPARLPHIHMIELGFDSVKDPDNFINTGLRYSQARLKQLQGKRLTDDDEQGIEDLRARVRPDLVVDKLLAEAA